MSRPPIHSNVSFDKGGAPPRPPPKGGSSKHYEGGAVPTLGYEEAGYGSGSYSQGGADVRRKKSMVRPERERIEPGHRLYHYQQHAADESVRVHPSGEFTTCTLCPCSHHADSPQRQATSRTLPTETVPRASAAASRCWAAMATRRPTSLVSTCSSAVRPFAARLRVQPHGPGSQRLRRRHPRLKSRAAAAPTLPPDPSTAG